MVIVTSPSGPPLLPIWAGGRSHFSLLVGPRLGPGSTYQPQTVCKNIQIPAPIQFQNLKTRLHLGCMIRKRVFGHMWTAKIQFSLRICAVWSGPSLSAGTITGYCRMYEWRAKAWTILWAWRWMIQIYAFCVFSKAFFFVCHCPFRCWKVGYNSALTLVLLSPDIPWPCKQCRSRSAGFWRSQLIWICTVCH